MTPPPQAPSKDRARSVRAGRSSEQFPSKRGLSYSDCPLNDKNIGIISENDHRVGLCLCQYCTCGNHICHSTKPAEPYPSSTFKTKYRENFKRYSFDRPLRNEPRRYVPNKLSMDLETTNQREFKPFKLDYHKTEPSRSLTPTANGVSITTYKNEFPDWGPNYVEYHKRFHPPVRSTELQFTGRSSYRDSFKTHDQHLQELYKTDITRLNAFGSTFQLGPKERFRDETTHKREFADFSKIDVNASIKVRAAPAVLNSTSKTHFKTTNQKTFTQKSNEVKDPRLMKTLLSNTFSGRFR
jgi:hypothetical protein